MEGQVSTRTKVLHALMVVVLTIVLLLFIAPFILVVINVFKTKADINTEPLALIGKHGFTLDNFPRAMEKMNFLTVFGNSAIITISATILTILFSAMCAYVIVRNPSWRFGGAVFALMVASMVIPFQVLMVPLVSVYGGLLIIDAMAFWNDYLLPSLVLGRRELYTIPIATQIFYGTYSNDIGLIMAALLLAMLPILILYLFLQRYIVEGVTSGAVKG